MSTDVSNPCPRLKALVQCFSVQRKFVECLKYHVHQFYKKLNQFTSQTYCNMSRQLVTVFFVLTQSLINIQHSIFNIFNFWQFSAIKFFGNFTASETAVRQVGKTSKIAKTYKK